MRVHELAKELNLKSQEIIDVLSGTEHAVSSHSSSIDEVAQQIVRNKFKSKGKTTQDMNIKSEEKNELKEYLKDIDPLKLSPIEALIKLNELKEISKKS